MVKTLFCTTCDILLLNAIHEADMVPIQQRYRSLTSDEVRILNAAHYPYSPALTLYDIPPDGLLFFKRLYRHKDHDWNLI